MMGLFNHDSSDSSSSSKSTCPALPEPLSVVGTIHKPFIYICAACLAVSFVICVSLIIAHLSFYSVPAEQRQIIRIVFTPVILTLISLLSVIWYDVYDYIKPVADVYEAVGLSSLFLLFLQYLNPSGTFGPELFNSLASQLGREGNHGFARLKWIMAFQFLIISPILLIATDATQAAGVYCAQSDSPHFGNLWITIIRTISLVTAVFSLLRMYKHTKQLMSTHRAGAKFLTFKVLLGIDVLQTWVIRILVQHNVINSGDVLSYGDLLYGVPSVLLALESVLFALSYWWAFSPQEYRRRRRTDSFFVAIFSAMNPMDLVKGVFRTFGLLGGMRKGYAASPSSSPSMNHDISYKGFGQSADSARPLQV